MEQRQFPSIVKEEFMNEDGFRVTEHKYLLILVLSIVLLRSFL